MYTSTTILKIKAGWFSPIYLLQLILFSCYDTDYFHFKSFRRDREINFYYYITVNISLELDSSTVHRLVDSKKINGAMVLIKIRFYRWCFFLVCWKTLYTTIELFEIPKYANFSLSTYLLHYEKLHFRYFLTTNKL